MPEAYLGEIRMFAGDFAPDGWALCDGSLLNIQGNEALYSIIGSSWGGDDRDTFGLPDLRGRVPIGSGTGKELTPRITSHNGGAEEVALTLSQMPMHSHAVKVSAAPATTATPGGNLLAATLPPAANYTKIKPTVPPAMLKATTLSQVGEGKPHNNVMPSYVINFIICTSGEYPTRSES